MTEPLIDTIQKATAADDTIGGEHLSFYWRSTWALLVLLVAGEIALTYFDFPAYVTRLVEAVGFIATAWFIYRRKRKFMTAAFAAAYVGCSAGFIVVVFELLSDPHVWRAFNLIARPIWMAAAGFIVGGFAAFIFGRFFLSSKLKGGDMHG